jgi:hypothetical protein
MNVKLLAVTKCIKRSRKSKKWKIEKKTHQTLAHGSSDKERTRTYRRARVTRTYTRRDRLAETQTRSGANQTLYVGTYAYGTHAHAHARTNPRIQKHHRKNTERDEEKVVEKNGFIKLSARRKKSEELAAKLA